MLSLSKTSIFIKNGVWGEAPSGVRAAAPVPPFPWERGQGDRDSKLEVCFKNRLFLQAKHTVHYNDALYALNLTNEGK